MSATHQVQWQGTAAHPDPSFFMSCVQVIVVDIVNGDTWGGYYQLDAKATS